MPGTSPEPAAAIAVVSWNTRELLDRCLASMRADAEAGRAEVWVVDNGSTDGSQALVREAHPWARLLEPGRNLGYGPAVNEVARRTRTPWVVPSNADLVLEPDALAELLRLAAASGAGVVCPRLILPDGSTQPAIQAYPGPWHALLRFSNAYKLSPRLAERLCVEGAWDGEAAADVDWATGAFVLVRRDAWDAVDGFDERQWMYAEDLDLCWRIRRAGWRIRYEPSAVVHHHMSVAAELAFGDEERRFARITRADYRWLADRRGPARAWATGLITVGLVGARVLALRLLGRRPAQRAAYGRLLRRHVEGLRELRGPRADRPAA